MAGKRYCSQTREQRVHGAWNFLVDPRLPADRCPAIWRAEDNPGVLVIVEGSESQAPLDVAAGRQLILERETRLGRHLVLAGRRERHRVLVTRSPTHPLGGFLIQSGDSLPIRLAALTAFHADPASRQAIAARAALRPSAYLGYRLKLLLAILDRLEEALPGQPIVRAIARELVYPRGIEENCKAIDWKSSSRRRQTQRLIAEARHMMTQGYRDLLGQPARNPPL